MFRTSVRLNIWRNLAGVNHFVLVNPGIVRRGGIDAFHATPDFDKIAVTGEHLGAPHGGVISQKGRGDHELGIVAGANNADFIIVHVESRVEPRAVYGCSAAILCRLP